MSLPLRRRGDDGPWARLLRVVCGGSRLGAMVQVSSLRALAMVVNVATGMLAAAMLGPHGRGEQAAMVLAPTFLGGIASIGLHAALIYNMKAEPSRQRAFLGNGILLTGGMGLLAVLVGWCVLPIWMHQQSARTIEVGRLLLLVTPLIVVQWSLTAAAEVQGWFGLANRMLYLQSLMTLCGLGLLAWTGLLTPVSSALTYILPMVPTFLYLFGTIVRRLRPDFRPDLACMRRLLRFGVRFAGVDLLSTISTSLDQLVIVACLPAREVGLYVVAVSAARLLSVVQTGIASVLYPSVAAGRTTDIVRTVALTFRLGVLVMGLVALGLGLVGPPLLLLAYGPRFAESITPFYLLLAGVVLENGARILYQTYSAAGRPGVVSLFEIVAVTCSVTLMLVLVPRFGLPGAGAAVIGAAAIRLCLAVSGLRLVVGAADRPRLLPGPADLRLIWTALATSAGIGKTGGESRPSGVLVADPEGS